MEMNRGRTTSGGWDENPPSASNLRGRRRSAWNPATWSPVAASFSPNRTYRAPGMAGGRRFAPTEHLAAEAVAAFVDGELGVTAHTRATQHLALCPECMAAVDAQMSARARLRSAGDVSIPATLLGQLSQIPTQEIDVADTGDRRDDATPWHRDGRTSPMEAPGFPVTEADRAGVTPDRAQPGTRARMSRWRGR